MKISNYGMKVQSNPKYSNYCFSYLCLQSLGGLFGIVLDHTQKAEESFSLICLYGLFLLISTAN